MVLSGQLSRYVRAWNSIVAMHDLADEYEVADGTDECVSLMAIAKLHSHGARLLSKLDFPVRMQGPNGSGSSKYPSKNA